MSQSPRVSVVVASYNYEDLVVETLDGLWAQTFRDFEIVVVDDGSADRSVENIRRFIVDHADADVSIRLLTHPDGGNHGLPATVELGVRASRGEFVAFCESDDLWTPDHLVEILNEVDRSGNRADIVVNDLEMFGDPNRCAAFARVCRARRAALRPGRNRISPAAFRDVNFILTFSCVCVRRDVLLACDFKPVGRVSALDWWLWRQICYDRPIWYVDRILTRWRMHTSQMVADHADNLLAERQRTFLSAGSRLLRRQHPLTSLWRLVRNTPPDPLGWRKTLRRILKRVAPYAMQRGYAARTYGIVFPDCVTWPGFLGWIQGHIIGCIPFGIVCWLKGFDPDNGIGGSPSSSGLLPSYRFSRAVRRRMEREREEGLAESAELLKRNRGTRILVALHLYYDNAWPVISAYLDNLGAYQYDLLVTTTEGRISQKTIDAIRSFAPTARILSCENRGFDLWPFAKALAEVDLGSYDVVFKLHSKGVGRPFIYLYEQIFKRTDWFYNLYDGILGGRTVHRAIDLLTSGGAKLVAAENLIVQDPPHKRRLVQDYCRDHGLDFVEDYRFVAGTCFAVRSEVLAPLKALALKRTDFEEVRRGVFSSAHAIERWMCFPAADAMKGQEVRRNLYATEVERCRAVSPLRLLEDSRFELDADFFYRVLEPRSVERYEVVRVRLGDIRRMTATGQIVKLETCEPYLFLRGDKARYEEYCDMNRAVTGFDMSPARFERLRGDMAQYDPRKMPVVRGDENVVMDGQHRCCILLDRHGPDHEIEVLRIW